MKKKHGYRMHRVVLRFHGQGPFRRCVLDCGHYETVWDDVRGEVKRCEACEDEPYADLRRFPLDVVAIA